MLVGYQHLVLGDFEGIILPVLEEMFEVLMREPIPKVAGYSFTCEIAVV